MNYISWCQIVLDLDLREHYQLYGILWNISYHFLGRLDLSICSSISLDDYQHFQCRIHFFSIKGGKYRIIDEIQDFMEYSRYFQRIYPSQANSRQRLNSSTQAKLEQQV